MVTAKLPLFLFLILMTTTQTTIAQENPSAWSLVKNDNGIKVYTRTLEHSDYKEFKALVSLDTDLKTLLKFITDADNCTNWQYRCLQKINLSDNYLYKLSHLPWPLSDRYTVMQSQGHLNPQNNIYTLNLKNIPREQLPAHILKQLPDEHDTVQMRNSDGYWQFQLDAPTINITYQMHGDPAGSLPADFANLGVINAAYVTLSNLKEQLPTSIPNQSEY